MTTICQAGGSDYVAVNLERAIDAAEIDVPEMFVSGPSLISTNAVDAGHLLRMSAKIARDPDDAKRPVRHWADAGVSSIKVHHPIHPWALAVGIEEAHRLGLPVLGHLRPSTWLAAARLGSDFIEHGFSIRTDRARFKALLAANVTMTESPVGNDPRSSAELDVLHPSAREYYLRNRSAKDPDAPITEPRGPGLAVAFAKAGGRVVVGSDRGGVPRIPSFSHSNSVRLLHDGLGFSELEAVRVATFSGARALGIDKRTGTVEEEKEADLVVLRGDPATRMAGIGNIDMALPQRTVVRPGSATCANERAVRVAVASRRREDAAVHEMQVKLQ